MELVASYQDKFAPKWITVYEGTFCDPETIHHHVQIIGVIPGINRKFTKYMLMRVFINGEKIGGKYYTITQQDELVLKHMRGTKIRTLKIQMEVS